MQTLKDQRSTFRMDEYRQAGTKIPNLGSLLITPQQTEHRQMGSVGINEGEVIFCLQKLAYCLADLLLFLLKISINSIPVEWRF